MVSFVWEPVSPLFGSLCPPSALALQQTFVCLDFPERINHTNKLLLRSLPESSATPPPPVNMPHSPAAHTGLV